MTPAPNISDAEWEVMRILWSRAPLTANEVVEALAGRRHWSPRTVKTLLNRLVKKGALDYEEQGNRYLYRPAVGQEDCIRSESRSFLDRVFGGAAGPMLNHFAQNVRLSPDEIAELRRILDRKEKRP